MMNHHLPPLPHGQPPVPPPPRRQHDMPYASTPPNVRSPQAYMGYHHPHPHATGPLPPYGPHQYHQQHWYPYQQMPHHAPPQPYQSYSPLIVSSYPRAQQIAAVGPPPSFPLQPSTASSTPQLSSFSATPPPPIPSATTSDIHEAASAVRPAETQPKEVDDSSSSSAAIMTPSTISPQASGKTRPKAQPTPREPFQPPVSFFLLYKPFAG